MKHLPLYVFNTDEYPKTRQEQFKHGKMDNIKLLITLSSGLKRTGAEGGLLPLVSISISKTVLTSRFNETVTGLKEVKKSSFVALTE